MQNVLPAFFSQPNPLLWVIPKGSCNFSKEYNKLHCKNNALQVGCKILGLLLLSNELFGISRKKLIMRVYKIKAYEMAYQAYYITHLLRIIPQKVTRFQKIIAVEFQSRHNGAWNDKENVGVIYFLCNGLSGLIKKRK